MGELQYEWLPRHVAVQVSLYRWVIATLQGDAEWSTPRYVAGTERMTEGQCHNKLCELQRKEREVKHG